LGSFKKKVGKAYYQAYVASSVARTFNGVPTERQMDAAVVRCHLGVLVLECLSSRIKRPTAGRRGSLGRCVASEARSVQ
jgi:hypothetical protein